MDVVRSEEEVEENLRKFEEYLCEGSNEEQQFAYDLVIKGRCFVAYSVGDEMRFSPSRYVGYSRNTMARHIQNPDKDGKETNAAINRVIGYILNSHEDLEREYLRFTSSLGIEPFNKRRKYWPFNVTGLSIGISASTEGEFPEGRLVERKHRARERSSKLVSAAKEKFIKENGRLYCIVCNFNFEEVYGKRGRGYIEAHHTIPVSEMGPGDKTNIEDIALVCANCHRILHRTRPWLKMDKLRRLLNK